MHFLPHSIPSHNKLQAQECLTSLTFLASSSKNCTNRNLSAGASGVIEQSNAIQHFKPPMVAHMLANGSS